MGSMQSSPHADAATPIDEEALAAQLPSARRRANGIYFTPAELVDAVVEIAGAWVPSTGSLTVLDPACGAGAFLAGAKRAWPRARLAGADLEPSALAMCRERLPAAALVQANSLTEPLESLWPALQDPSFEVWLGNPPFQGRSPLLDEPKILAALLPSGFRMPKGTSLRDDYALFLLRAAERLRQRSGLLAFVTPASLLDAYAYAPLRDHLLSTLSLRHVLDLGGKVFAQARVSTCVTFWTSPRQRVVPRHQSRSVREGPFTRSQLQPARDFSVTAPQWLLRPFDDEAEALDAQWRKQGEPLDVLVPISLTGLKTRFEQLWVAPTREILETRVKAFFETPASQLSNFAAAFGFPRSSLPKLQALKALAGAQEKADGSKLWPFFALGAPRVESPRPTIERGFCYLDPPLIPRGDHRFRGMWNPHRCPTKLVFNARERPLFAFVLDEPGCVPAFQHTRFAPLFVPRVLRDGGLRAVRSDAELADEVPNLSPRGLEWAERLKGPAEVFSRIATFVASSEVQKLWAPAFATTRTLPVPLSIL